MSYIGIRKITIQDKCRADLFSNMSTIRVMTYNIKFGGGRLGFKLDCCEQAITKMDAPTVMKNLDAICALINQYKPEVLLLQEVDYDSERSARIDQLQYILEHTNFCCALYSAQWKRRWSLLGRNEVLGGINTGNAILSVLPLENEKRYNLPSEILLGFKRNILSADLRINGEFIRIANLHAPVGGIFQTLKKKRAMRTIMKFVNSNLCCERKKLSILGGDFNNTPYTNADIKLSGFADIKCKWPKKNSSNYNKTKDLMLPLYIHDRLMEVTGNGANPEHHSCSLDETVFWNRKLDYLFTDAPVMTAETLQTTSGEGVDPILISDHAPIIADIQV